MIYGSVFSGIGGGDLGADAAGMVCAWQVELDAACRGKLAEHWPNTERLIDVRECGKYNLKPVDVLIGGFPCQDLSVAGKRAGLAGERSGLWFEFHRLLAELGPSWVVIENVPGLLSSNKGRDFAIILRGLVELGYGVCWRVLDAQYFGLAQRRERVFVVGHLGDGRAAQILLESEGSDRRAWPRRTPGQEVAAPLTRGSAASSGVNDPGRRREDDINLVVTAFESRYVRNGRGAPSEIVPPLKAQSGKTGKGDSAPLIAYAVSENQRGEVVLSEYSHQLTTGGGKPGQGYAACLVGVSATLGASMDRYNDIDCTTYIPSTFGVRRLTPTECERLQGFPDGWTAGQSDSARYRQLGNAWAVPVAAWIMKRIVAADNACLHV